jgi:very-short-patch-repair endonuclease
MSRVYRSREPRSRSRSDLTPCRPLRGEVGRPGGKAHPLHSSTTRRSVDGRVWPHPLSPSPTSGEGEPVGVVRLNPEFWWSLHPSLGLQTGGMRRAKMVRARELRARQTPAEAFAWELLRNRRCLGLKFRRQQVLYGFIADFYCAELRLAIELDGEVHEDRDRQTQDGFRDLALECRDIRVIRIKNRELSRKRLIAAIQAARK